MIMRNIFTLLFIVIFSSSLVAQQGKDPEAKAILEKVKNKVESFSSFKVNYTFHLKSSVSEMDESYDGEIIVQDKKFAMKNGDGTETYNNGKKVWTYYEEENEVNVYDYDPEDEMFSFNKILNVKEEDYKFRMMGEETIEGTVCYVIDLEPDLTPEERKTNQVYKIRVHIDKSTSQLVRWKIFERNGNRYTTTINKFEPNVPVTKDTFVFDKSKHKGVTVIDMSAD